MTWEELEATAIDGRTCRRCKTWKPLGKFHKDSDRVCTHCYYLASVRGQRLGFGRARGIVVINGVGHD